MFQKMFWNEITGWLLVEGLGGDAPIPRRRAKNPAGPPSGVFRWSVANRDYSLLFHYRLAQTIVTRSVVEFGLLPQRAPFACGTSG